MPVRRLALAIAALGALVQPSAAVAASRTVPTPLPSVGDLGVQELDVRVPAGPVRLRVANAAALPAGTTIAAAAERRGRTRAGVDAVVIRRGADQGAGPDVAVKVTVRGRARPRVIGGEQVTDLLGNPSQAGHAAFCTRGGFRAPAPAFHFLVGDGFGFTAGQIARFGFDMACRDQAAEDALVRAVREGGPTSSGGGPTQARWTRVAGDPNGLLLVFQVTESPVYFVRAGVVGPQFESADVTGASPANLSCFLSDVGAETSDEVTCGHPQCPRSPNLLQALSAQVATPCGGRIEPGIEYRGRVELDRPVPDGLGGTLLVEQQQADPTQPDITTAYPISGP
jgi:hypothetical protein